MKSLVRWTSTLALVGSTLLTTFTTSITPAIALSKQQIKGKLDNIPVWLITNPQGLPLSRSKQDGNSVTGVYMSRQEAQAFINKIGSVADPKFSRLQATPIPLGVIFQEAQKTKNQPKRLLFAFKPVDKEIQGAKNLLQRSGQQVSVFRSVPVFMVRFAPDKSYVPIKLEQNQEIVPLFFSMQDAKNLLNKVKPKFPQADIQVVDVDGILNTLRAKNDPWLNRVVFYPSPEARAYISNPVASKIRNIPVKTGSGNMIRTIQNERNINKWTTDLVPGVGRMMDGIRMNTPRF